MGFIIGGIVILNNKKTFFYTCVIEYDKYVDAINNLAEVENSNS